MYTYIFFVYSLFILILFTGNIHIYILYQSFFITLSITGAFNIIFIVIIFCISQMKFCPQFLFYFGKCI